jgi:hypothetical protein
MPGSTSAQAAAERLARDFLERVWGPAHDIGAIDDLMTCDYVIHAGGGAVRGRDAFKAWVVEFHRLMPEAVDEILDVFANAAGDRASSGATRSVPGQP